ncbi:MAG: hypothetical protein WAW42_10905 [Candidatus Competibacteraceae bacterium]
MIYEPNTTKWTVGALVIHDCDAKRTDMLMRVMGYDRVTGECKTRYAYRMDDEVWLNDVRYLHDPARFSISVPPNESHALFHIKD